MGDWLGSVKSVLQVWYAGQEYGNALADVLSGIVNPSGRLPMTVPKRIEDTPAFAHYPGESGHVRYGEGIFVGYRYYDHKAIEPEFPFGHGLSYTRFNITNSSPTARTTRRMRMLSSRSSFVMPARAPGKRWCSSTSATLYRACRARRGS